MVDAPLVAHNTFLSVLVELGVGGALLLAGLLGCLFYCASRMRYMERCLWIILLLTWAIGGSTLTWEYHKPTWLLFALLAAHAYSRRRVERQLEKPAFEPEPSPRRWRTAEALTGATRDLIAPIQQANEAIRRVIEPIRQLGEMFQARARRRQAAPRLPGPVLAVAAAPTCEARWARAKGARGRRRGGDPDATQAHQSERPMHEARRRPRLGYRSRA